MTIERFKRGCCILAGVISILAIALGTVFAQRIMAGIRGKVSDMDGNPLDKVTIIIRDTQRGNIIKLETDKDGKFFRMGLDASLYEIKYQLEGYRTIRMMMRISRDRTPLQDIVLVKLDEKAMAGNDFEIGNKLLKEGNYDGAISIFQEVIQEVPDYVEAYYKLAICHIETNESDKAIPYLEKAIELKPDYAPHYMSLGQIYLEKGKSDEAAKYFVKAGELQPDNAEIFFKIGKANCSILKFDKAIESLQKSIELNDSYAYSYYQIGIAYGKLENREKMIENFEKFLEMKNDAPEASRVKELIKQAKEQLSKQTTEN